MGTATLAILLSMYKWIKKKFKRKQKCMDCQFLTDEKNIPWTEDKRQRRRAFFPWTSEQTAKCYKSVWNPIKVYESESDQTNIISGQRICGYYESYKENLGENYASIESIINDRKRDRQHYTTLIIGVATLVFSAISAGFVGVVMRFVEYWCEYFYR